MHLSTNFVVLALLAQGLSTFALPVVSTLLSTLWQELNYRLPIPRQDVADETSLTSREPELDVRDFELDLDARFLVDDLDSQTLDARDWEDIIDTIDLRSLSEEDIAALEARGLNIKGISKVSRQPQRPQY